MRRRNRAATALVDSTSRTRYAAGHARWLTSWAELG